MEIKKYALLPMERKFNGLNCGFTVENYSQLEYIISRITLINQQLIETELKFNSFSVLIGLVDLLHRFVNFLRKM